MHPLKQLPIKVSDEELKGRYANGLQITHTSEEFIFDFLNTIPPEGQLIARIITSPQHAKRILAVLQENLAKYEEKFGEITEAKPQKTIIRTEKPS